MSTEMSAEQVWLADLEAALSGQVTGPAATAWRELREDVRTLAAPMSPQFERTLAERIATQRRAGRPTQATSKAWGSLSWRSGGAGLAVLAVVIVAIVIAGPWHMGRGAKREASPQPRAASSSEGTATPDSSTQASAAPTSAAGSAAAAAGASATPQGRVQQLSASISLGVAASEVQEIANRVSELTASEGGYVASSHVQVQQVGESEANLMLALPSARLSAALASLGRLAPVRSESQSLQDLTSTYDTARQRLTDATAERRALLHALAKASTVGQIDSLREQLAQARTRIADARSALNTLKHQTSTAEVEVTVLGSPHAESGGLTLHKGLDDAEHVLVVTLVVLLIAAAIMVPLSLMALALIPAARSWRRRRRERVLDAS
jgi:hypothetical protein